MAICHLQRCASSTESSHIGPVVGVYQRRKPGLSLLRREEACNLCVAAEEGDDDNKEMRIESNVATM